jgi:hypothetical protein
VRVLLAVLTHHDLPRLRRAVASVKQQRRTRGVEVDAVVVVNSLDRDYERLAVRTAAELGVRAVATESNGRPGRGKNACLDLFLQGGADYLCQLDGDDWLYPTWAESVAEHLRRLPQVDALGIVPIDCVGSAEGFTFEVEPGVAAGVWTTSSAYPFESAGPGVAPLWEEPGTTANPDMIRLLSRAAAARWRFDEELAIGEDTLMSLALLSSHQQGELSYWLTMASDWMIVDRTTPGSVQRTYSHGEALEPLLAKAAKLVDPARSSAAELPIVYPPLLLSAGEKRSWIERTWRLCVNGSLR